MKPLILAAAVLLAGLTGCGSSAEPTEKPLEGNRGVAGPKGRLPIGTPAAGEKARP